MVYGIHKLYNHNNKEKREAKQTTITQKSKEDFTLYSTKWLESLPEEILQVENQRLNLEAGASERSLFQNQNFKTTM